MCQSLFKYIEEDEAITYGKVLLPFENEIKFLQIIVCFGLWVFFGFVLKDDFEETIALLLKFALSLEHYLKLHFLAVVYLSFER